MYQTGSNVSEYITEIMEILTLTSYRLAKKRKTYFSWFQEIPLSVSFSFCYLSQLLPNTIKVFITRYYLEIQKRNSMEINECGKQIPPSLEISSGFSERSCQYSYLCGDKIWSRIYLVLLSAQYSIGNRSQTCNANMCSAI